MRKAVVGLVATLGLIGGAEASHGPKDALGAVAVSADGTKLIAAGDNRVMYVLDPSSLEVKQRVFIGVNPFAAFFSKDGNMLDLIDGNGVIHLFSTADWSEKSKVEGAGSWAVLPGSDAIAVLGDPKWAEGDKYTTAFTIYGLSDGAVKTQASIQGSARYIAAAPDGSAFAVLLEQAQDADEKQVDVPDNLSGAARDEFYQKNDGYTASLVKLDATGKETGRTKTWYSTSDNVLAGTILGGTTYFVGNSNVGLKVTADGTMSVFKLSEDYIYGVGLSNDGTKFFGGGQTEGSIYDPASNASVTWQTDALPGWSEYVVDFSPAADGSIFASTSGYRVAHIGADGKVSGIKSIF